MSSISASRPEHHIDAWRRNGFVIVDNFLDEETLDLLRIAYDDILTGKVSAAGDRMLGQITRQVMVPSAAHAAFDDNQALDTGMSVARQLFGTDDVFRTFDMLIYKAPGHLHETPWHQDAAYSERPFARAGSPVSTRNIQFWLPLDDVDAENGCMQFIPGYHESPLMEHRVVSGLPDDDSRLLALTDPATQIDIEKRVVAEIPAGGATMHASGTPHFTGPNRSVDRPRRSYIFNIAAV